MRTSVDAWEASSPTRYAWQDLPDGRSLQFFVNVQTGLVVVDLIDADEEGGTEILRRNV